MGSPQTSSTPLTPTEEALATLWSTVLGEKPSSRSADFFDCGGDSFLATKAIVTVRQRWRIDVDVDAVFQNRTIGELARRIDELVAAAGSPLPVQGGESPDGH